MRLLIIAAALLISAPQVKATEIGVQFSPVSYTYISVKEHDNSIYFSVPNSSYIYLSSPVHRHITIRGLLDFSFRAFQENSLSFFSIGAIASYSLLEHNENGSYLEAGLRIRFINSEYKRRVNNLILGLGYKKRLYSNLVLRPNLEYQRELNSGHIRTEVYSLNLGIGKE